jgi:hypothetical protein
MEIITVTKELVMPSWEEVKELIPAKVSLYYVDYRDSLDGSLETIQKCIHKGSADLLWETVDDWFVDDHYGMDYCKDELKKEIESKWDIDDADYVMEQYEDEIRDTLYDRDDSTVMKDLIRNTSDPVMFYDTGHYVESGFPLDEAHCRLERYKIKKLLSIDTGHYDSLIDNMLYQASYGGYLHIYFEGDIDDWLDIDEKVTHIRFRGIVHIGVINSSNGSGDITDFKMDFKLPFNKENVFIDKCTSYNWTYQIAGMCGGWCNTTVYEFEVGEPVAELPTSNMNAHIEKEAEYDRVYKAGGCSRGDTNISRHRNTPYFNEPMYCRNECKSCGQVWLD